MVTERIGNQAEVLQAKVDSLAPHYAKLYPNEQFDILQQMKALKEALDAPEGLEDVAILESLANQIIADHPEIEDFITAYVNHLGQESTRTQGENKFAQKLTDSLKSEGYQYMDVFPALVHQLMTEKPTDLEGFRKQIGTQISVDTLRRVQDFIQNEVTESGKQQILQKDGEKNSRILAELLKEGLSLDVSPVTADWLLTTTQFGSSSGRNLVSLLRTV